MNDEIPAILRDSKTIAVVGLSTDPARPSHEVAAYLQRQGYRIIPINPLHAGQRILGEHCYPTLTQAHATLVEEGVTIDIVDCFRRAEHIGPIVEEAIPLAPRCIWMQLGVSNAEAAEQARRAGIAVVMDTCIKIAHMQLY